MRRTFSHPIDRSRPISLADWIRLVRPHQWTKNLLILAPALAAHQALDAAFVTTMALAVVAFSLLASGIYVVNDLLDREHDRKHPVKKNRPLASGALSAGAGLGAAGVLLLVGASVTFFLLPEAFGISALVYVVLALGYSLGLKRVVVLDVLVLAALYSVRVVAGAGAAGVPLSRWFVAFSVFVFFSLALVKRAVELRSLETSGEAQAPGRGWRTGDLNVLQSMGAASAVAGALVYCLYITSEDVLRLYAAPDYLWLGLPLLLYWLGRIWILVPRDEVADDPVVFALRDPSSYAVAGLMALVIWLAT